MVKTDGDSEGGAGTNHHTTAAVAEEEEAAARTAQAKLERELYNAGRILPQQLIPRYCSELKLPRELQDVSMSIVGNLQTFEVFPARKPQVIGALAVYMAHFFFPNVEIGRADIAEHTGVSQNILKAGHKKMCQVWEKLLPDNVKQSYDAEQIAEIIQY